MSLLKKFGLLEGKNSKEVVHIFLDNKMFVVFIYFINIVEEKSNILNSEWIKYGFMDKQVLIERIRKNEFKQYFDIYYYGDNLKIETKIEYEKLYDIIK